MSLYVNTKNGGRKRVREYDTSLMLTLKDVIPNDPAFAKRSLQRSKSAPEGRLRDFYNSKCNSSLIRKIFTFTLKCILWEVAAGNCSFSWPNKSTAKIFVGTLNDSIVRSKAKFGKLNYIDLTRTDYTVPYLTMSFPKYTKKADIKVYVNKEIFNTMIAQANTGKGFSKRPRQLDYFLPYIYEEFSYISESSIRNLITECFSKLLFTLKQGEEVRILDNTGEIRFFRALGNLHDEVMTKVVKRRMEKEHKEKYEKFFI